MKDKMSTTTNATSSKDKDKEEEDNGKTVPASNDKRECYKCGDIGHIARDCPKKGSNEKSVEGRWDTDELVGPSRNELNLVDSKDIKMNDLDLDWQEGLCEKEDKSKRMSNLVDSKVLTVYESDGHGFGTDSLEMKAGSHGLGTNDKEEKVGSHGFGTAADEVEKASSHGLGTEDEKKVGSHGFGTVVDEEKVGSHGIGIKCEKYAGSHGCGTKVKDDKMYIGSRGYDTKYEGDMFESDHGFGTVEDEGMKQAWIGCGVCMKEDDDKYKAKEMGEHNLEQGRVLEGAKDGASIARYSDMWRVDERKNMGMS